MGNTPLNVVLILTDQQRATGPYDSRMRAFTGSIFTSKHSGQRAGISTNTELSVVHVPSRASLFTACLQPPTVSSIPMDSPNKTEMQVTLAGQIHPTLGHARTLGIQTASGKWHLSPTPLPDAAAQSTPNPDDDEAWAQLTKSYAAENLLNPFGFDDWVGPEPMVIYQCSARIEMHASCNRHKIGSVLIPIPDHSYWSLVS